MNKLWIVELEYTPAQEYGEDVYTIIGKILAPTYKEAGKLTEKYLGSASTYAGSHNKSTTGYSYVTYAMYHITCIDDLYDISKSE